MHNKELKNAHPKRKFKVFLLKTDKRCINGSITGPLIEKLTAFDICISQREAVCS
jgi:hypothetical protein